MKRKDNAARAARSAIDSDAPNCRRIAVSVRYRRCPGTRKGFLTGRPVNTLLRLVDGFGRGRGSWLFFRVGWLDNGLIIEWRNGHWDLLGVISIYRATVRWDVFGGSVGMVEDGFNRLEMISLGCWCICLYWFEQFSSSDWRMLMLFEIVGSVISMFSVLLRDFFSIFGKVCFEEKSVALFIAG